MSILTADQRLARMSYFRERFLLFGVAIGLSTACGSGNSGEALVEAVDLDPPTAGLVFDGTGEDIVTQVSLDTIYANWIGFGDNVGVYRYEWCIGESPGAHDVQPWMSVGAATHAHAQGLNLTIGVTYIVSVRAYDGAGNTSAVASSDGVLVVPPPLNTNSPLGTNLTEVNDYSTQLPFLDVFKSSMRWVSGTVTTWDDGRPLDLDQHGNVRSLLPGQIASTVTCWAMAGMYPSGRYLALYEGQGTLRFGGSATRNAALSVPGRDVLDVNAAQGGILLQILTTQASDYVRNIRIVREPFEHSHAQLVFDPNFLDKTSRYSTLRFMDWGRTNNSTIAAWSERALVTDVRWSTHRGVPYEIMFDLANRLQTDAWICIPHLADDNYISSLATLARNRLDPQRKLYVEYSNEVWNTLFTQASYCESRGLGLGLSTNPVQARLYFQSLRSVQIFGLFESAFGGTSRLVRVLAGQSVNTWTSLQLLDFQNAYLHTDALAGAPYFGPIVSPTNGAQIEAMNVDELLDHVESVHLPAQAGHIQQNVALANQRGLPFISYEGGQHLVGIGQWSNNTAMTAKLIAANRHPRMHGIYLDYLGAWRAQGAQLFVHFSDIGVPSMWGSWGSLEYRDQDVQLAPKYQALQTFIGNNPRWW